MPDPEKGSGALIVIGSAKPKSDEYADKPKDKSGSLSATKAFMKAVKDGDAEAADEALRLHYELCQAESPEDED